MLRFYVDEDAMDQDLVRALRARGADVTTALDAGMVERPDEQHLDHAAGEGRVLFSFNVGDFYRIHGTCLAEGRHHAGIALAGQQQYSVGEQMRRLLRMSSALTPEEMRDRLEFLNSWG